MFSAEPPVSFKALSEALKEVVKNYFLRILSKGVLWWHGNLHVKMHGNISAK